MTAIKDLTGLRFGRLLVLERVPKPEHIKSGTYWLCRCDCGNKKIIWSWSLLGKITLSCGCLRLENFEKRKIGEKQSAINRLYRNYKRKARDRNLFFDLPRELFIGLTSNNCYYCGCEPKQICRSENKTGDYIYNGIDRLNNDVGYVLENSVPCCKQCNRAKTDYNINEFYNWVDNIIKNKEK